MQAANDSNCNTGNLLFPVVEELLRCGSREVHLAQEPEYCRLRHRINGELTESKIYQQNVVDTVLSQLRSVSRQPTPGECASFRISAERIEPMATIDAVYFQTAAGPCLTLTLQTPLRIPEMLEQLVLDDHSIQQLRAELQSNLHGAALVLSDRPSCLSDLYHALVAESNRLTGKSLSLEYQVTRPLPRLTQLSPPLYADADTMTSNALKGADRAFCDWQCNQPGSFYGTPLWQSTIPMVSFHLAHSGSVAMRDLTAHGSDRQAAAGRLEKVVCARETGTLCPHCADCHQPGPLQQKWLDDHAAILLPDQPSMFFASSGCSRCDETGVSGQLQLIEVSRCDDAMAEAFASRDSQAFDLALQANLISESIAHQAHRAANSGTITFDHFQQLIDSQQHAVLHKP